MFSLLFWRKLQCQMEKTDGFLWKIHSFHPNNPWGFYTSGRIQYKSADCLQRREIFWCHVPHQKWVRKRNICTSHFAGFGIVSASQDYILWRCKERKQKLWWLRNKHRNLKWKDLGALEAMRTRKKVHDDNHKKWLLLLAKLEPNTEVCRK